MIGSPKVNKDSTNIAKQKIANLAKVRGKDGDKQLESTKPMPYKAFPNVILPRLKMNIGTR